MVQAMAPRKKTTRPPGVDDGSASPAEVTSRPVRRPTPKMIKRVGYNGRILQPGDPCPMTGADLERWQRNGFADHG